MRAGERPAPAPPRVLTGATLAEGARALSLRDPDLAALFARNGLPPMWARRPGFPTLVHIVLEQQVSIAAARTLFRRVREALGEMTPELVVERGILGLHRLGTDAAESRVLPRARTGGDGRQPLALRHRARRRRSRPLGAPAACAASGPGARTSIT